MNKRRYIGMFLTLALMCTACIKENTEDCFSGLRLSFDFSLHTEKPGNRFSPDVKVIRVYCFDLQGVLRHIQEGSGKALTNDYVMEVNLDPGKYTIVAWGGGRDDFFGSYHEADAADTGAKRVTVGKTTLDQFRIIMNCIPVTAVPEQTAPEDAEMDDLYYGAVGLRNTTTSAYDMEQVEVKTGTFTDRRIELIRDTNILKITVSGIDHLGITQPGDFKLWTMIANGEYLSDNSITGQTPTIRYTPYYNSTFATSVSAGIKLLRMDMERHKADPILLYIEAPDGRRFPAKPIDVVNTLLQARDPETKEYVYNSQSDFDRIYEHPIEVRIGSDLGITIYIGEWEIVYVKPD